VFISTGSTPYIYVPIATPLADPTALAVSMALIPEGQSAPGSGDWKAATWRSPGTGLPKEVACLRDAAVWPDGEYMCFVQVNASPEVLVLPAGRVRIGDTRG